MPKYSPNDTFGCKKGFAMQIGRRSILKHVFGLSLVTVSLTSSGGALAQAPEEVLLTIQGSEGEKTTLHLSDLDALPQRRFSTSTIWTEGPMEFSGPALADVLASSGLGMGVLRLRAANDYSVLLEPSMIGPNAPIVATRIDGKTFGVRDRGPLWLVFPYDADPRYRTEPIYSLSIWQLTDISAASAP